MDMESSFAGDVEYADHEVQVLGKKINVSDDLGDGLTPLAGSQEGETIIEFNPVSDRGIDSDELAELVGFYRLVKTRIQGAGSNATNSEANCEGVLGINLTFGDLPNRVVTNGTVVNDSPDLQVDQILGRIGAINLDEPGVIDMFAQGANVGFGTSPDNAGGASQITSPSERTFFYGDKLGSGPYVDQTDEMTLALEIELADFTADVDVEVEVNYILYWNVHEMPEGRASFARP
jgi:hypothetical protein